MQRFGWTIPFLGICLSLSGCNTPDALTPQAEVPNAGDKAANQRVAARSENNPNEVAEVPVDTGNRAERAPQNTLEAQAQALEAGMENPVETRSDTAVATRNNDGTLGANLFRNDAGSRQVSSLYSANAQAKGTIRFLPIIGAPLQAVTPLSRQLGNAARSSGLQIKGSSDLSAEHVLKGYLSAYNDGGNITVVYVWDILDNAGARLHRIQGQEKVKARGADTWGSVPPEVMERIGEATIAEYLRWRNAQG